MVFLHTAIWTFSNECLRISLWLLILLRIKHKGPYYGLQPLCALTLTTSWPYLLLPSPVHSIPDNRPLCCFWNIPKYTRLRASVLVFPCAQNNFSRNAYGLLIYFLQHSAQKSSYVRELFQLPYIKQYHSHAHQSFSIPFVLTTWHIVHFFKKICLTPKTIRPIREEALFLPLLYSQYLK